MIGDAVEQRAIGLLCEFESERRQPVLDNVLFVRPGWRLFGERIGVSHAITVRSLGLARFGGRSVDRLRFESRRSGRVQDRSCPAKR